MKNNSKIRRLLIAVNNFFCFFLLSAFIITSCLLLFITVMSDSLGIELTTDNVERAAKLTFGNVLFLSLLFSVIDAIRRKIMIDRPAKKITDAAEKIMQGDFSVRIKTGRNLNSEDRFGEIADCFNKMAEELSSIETLRTDFIANVSHELKSPLAVIQNYGRLLQDSDLSEGKRTEYAKVITETSGKLAALITGILKLSKLENQNIAPRFSEYDLCEQVCECLLGFENAWEKKKLNIETDIEDGIIVKSDAEMMELVWNNLFSNAIKFTDEGGTIALSVSSDEKYVTVRISDTGCGISAEVGKHMFDKFYQGDTSHATQGNGLGLAIVKRVIDITGNDISVESELGKGTAFTVKVRR